MTCCSVGQCLLHAAAGVHHAAARRRAWAASTRMTWAGTGARTSHGCPPRSRGSPRSWRCPPAISCPPPRRSRWPIVSRSPLLHPPTSRLGGCVGARPSTRSGRRLTRRRGGCVILGSHADRGVPMVAPIGGACHGLAGRSFLAQSAPPKTGRDSSSRNAAAGRFLAQSGWANHPQPGPSPNIGTTGLGRRCPDESTMGPESGQLSARAPRDLSGRGNRSWTFLRIIERSLGSSDASRTLRTGGIAERPFGAMPSICSDFSSSSRPICPTSLCRRLVSECSSWPSGTWSASGRSGACSLEGAFGGEITWSGTRRPRSSVLGRRRPPTPSRAPLDNGTSAA